MFLILLGFVLSVETPDPTKLCLKTSTAAGAPSCPTGYQAVADEVTLLAAITADATSIYTDKMISAIPIAKLQKVAEIKLLGTTQVKVSCAITANADHSGLTLSNINLEITATAPPTSKKLKADPAVLNFAKLTLEDGAILDNAATVSVVELKCTTAASAVKAILSCKGTNAKFILEGNDVVTKVTADSAGAKLNDGTTDIAITATGYTTSVISTVTKVSTFTLSGDFSTLTAQISIELKNGHVPNCFVTLEEDNTFKAKNFLTVTVNAYYKEGTSLTAAGKGVYTINADLYLVNGDGKRIAASIPAVADYCLLKTGTYATDCPKGSEGLWDEAELLNANNGDKVVNIYLIGYDSDSAMLALTFDAYKAKSLKFIGKKQKQFVSLKLKTTSDVVTGKLQFDNIDLIALTTTDGESTLGFSSLFVRKSTITANKAAVAKKLKTDPATPAIKVTSADLTSDAASFTGFKVEKPTKSFTVIDVASANFDVEGKKVTIDGVEFTDAKIPTPFTIQSTEAVVETKLIITTTGEAAAKVPLPFNFNVPAGTTLKTEFTGDWSANDIIANVEEKGNYIGTLASGAKKPDMSKTGAGNAELDGEKVKDAPPTAGETPTPKGGLSGGAIAGIVIACVVVVAAVVVVVVVVIKKKKGKVAN